MKRSFQFPSLILKTNGIMIYNMDIFHLFQDHYSQIEKYIALIHYAYYYHLVILMQIQNLLINLILCKTIHFFNLYIYENIFLLLFMKLIHLYSNNCLSSRFTFLFLCFLILLNDS